MVSLSMKVLTLYECTYMADESYRMYTPAQSPGHVVVKACVKHTARPGTDIHNGSTIFCNTAKREPRNASKTLVFFDIHTLLQ